MQALQKAVQERTAEVDAMRRPPHPILRHQMQAAAAMARATAPGTTSSTTGGVYDTIRRAWSSITTSLAADWKTTIALGAVAVLTYALYVERASTAAYALLTLLDCHLFFGFGFGYLCFVCVLQCMHNACACITAGMLLVSLLPRAFMPLASNYAY